MIITCPRCLATYNVPATALGAGGRDVRCTSCSFEWHEAPMPQDAIAHLAPQGAVSSAATPERPSAPASAAYVSGGAVKKAKASSATVPKSKVSTPKATAVISMAVMATVLAGGVLLRNTISAMIPQMEGVYETIGLSVGSPAEWFKIEGKGVESAEDGNRFTLTVHGEITNISKRPRTLTPIRITWVGKDGQVGASTTVVSAASRLAPDEKAGFIGILNRVDTSLGGEIRMVPWLGASDVVVKPSDSVGPNHLVAVPQSPATSTHTMDQGHGEPSSAHMPSSAHEPPPVQHVSPEPVHDNAPPAQLHSAPGTPQNPSPEHAPSAHETGGSH